MKFVVAIILFLLMLELLNLTEALIALLEDSSLILKRLMILYLRGGHGGLFPSSRGNMFLDCQ
ncbi:hypothetical protein [Wolbachia endosymbiont of Dirofilaria (Dirofilaria) immitis]|uniref:hypothetical protein n=1 Tax=Wolbachia endosymbiont of Dirofilaria (Dirofilaria) immitis TaxID=1812115 RepID=UPI00159A5D70|nr:hypothetical protein [Wolbachia endosymbiont of Dirofilaria (Dirofilaria) immitis]QKX02028.1 hypothetical protein GOY12_00215 [Wolbachia endosymbiont of Dirofilaria (Dirofilaria) immitis]